MEVDFASELGDRRAVDIWSDAAGDDLVDGGCSVKGFGYRWIRLRHAGDGLLL